MSGVRKLLRVVCGWTLLVVGVLGLFLPFLQGILMILAGAALLGWDFTVLRKYRDRFLDLWKKRRFFVRKDS